MFPRFKVAMVLRIGVRTWRGSDDEALCAMRLNWLFAEVMPDRIARQELPQVFGNYEPLLVVKTPLCRLY
jgi:hypothetical protein